MKEALSAFLFVLLIPASASFAQTVAPPQGAAAEAASSMNDTIAGEGRKIDKDAGKITLRHGEIKQLDMPPMTMVFRVKNPAMLEAVKPGDKVKFKIEGKGGALMVTEIAPAK